MSILLAKRTRENGNIIRVAPIMHSRQHRDTSGSGQVYHGRRKSPSERSRHLEPDVPLGNVWGPDWFWAIDAWLHLVGQVIPSAATGDMEVPGFPQVIAGSEPAKYAIARTLGPTVTPLVPAGLYKLYTIIRWTDFPGGPVRLAGRGEGPLMEFFLPV